MIANEDDMTCDAMEAVSVGFVGATPARNTGSKATEIAKYSRSDVAYQAFQRSIIV